MPPRSGNVLVPTIEQHVLSNGLRLNLVHMPHVHRAAIDVHVRVGSRFESARDNGISHFHEHMLHRGVAGFPSAHAQAMAFEELGAAFGAMTYVDHGVLSCSLPIENLEAGLELTARLCEAPLLGQIEVEKGIVREELLEGLDARGRLVDGNSLLRRLCFGEHPLGMPIAGTRRNLARFDVRALRSFHRRHYVGRGLVLTLAGRLDLMRAKRFASRRFVALPPGRELPAPQPPPEQTRARFEYVRDAGSQTWLGLAFRAPSERDPLEPATELLLRILDDGNATRLYHALSDERGLCYDVAALYEAHSDTGVFEIVAECAHASTPRVLRQIGEVLSDLARQGPSERELAKAKARVAWQTLELYDMPAELAGFVGQATLSAGTCSPAARARQLSNVSRTQVQAAAERIFRAATSSLVVVGALDRSTRARLARLQQQL
jgi:predicted Zn-dependent peptidase